MEPQENRTTRICVAVVASAHGVRGAIRLRCYTARPEDVAAYGPVFDRDGTRRFDLEIVGRSKGGVIARLEGINDRDAADALRGVELYVPRRALPDLAEDEFYHSDLEGLDAVGIDGVRLGQVRRVVNFGAGDTIEIRTDQGGVLTLPFDRRTVPVVDLVNRRITIDPPRELVAEDGR